MTTERNPLEDLRKTLIALAGQYRDEAREQLLYAREAMHGEIPPTAEYWRGKHQAYLNMIGEINTAFDNAIAAARPAPVTTTDLATYRTSGEAHVGGFREGEIILDTPPRPATPRLTAAQRRALKLAARRHYEPHGKLMVRKEGVWSRREAPLQVLNRLEKMGLVEFVDSFGGERSDGNVDVLFVATAAGRAALAAQDGAK